MEIKIKWQVNDGYVGDDRPQYTEIDPSSFSIDDDEEYIREAIETSIEEDFRQNICPTYKQDQIESAVERIMEYLKERSEEEE